MDFVDKCRTCLGTPEQPKDLFKDENLLRTIKIISSVQIEYLSEFPTQICGECFKNINYFEHFRKVIINTEHELQKRLQYIKETNCSLRPQHRVKHETEGNNGSDFLIDVKDEPQTDLKSDLNLDNGGDSSEDGLDVKETIAVEKASKCQDCERPFNSEVELKNHRHTMHVPSGKCYICGKVVRADHLRKHIRLHSDEPCVCEDCGKTLKNTESLRTHKLLHVQQAVTCEICGKISKSKRSHGGHLREHREQEKKVVCYLCGKRVRFLKKHILTHSGEKPFACPYCNKKFTLRYNLKVHTRLHLNDKPFKCEYCCNAFTQKVLLKTHLRTKHEH